LTSTPSRLTSGADQRESVSTIAETISARFGDDGQNWTDDEGADIVEIVEDESVSDCRPRGGSDDIYFFADGSAIVVMHGGWDVLDGEGRDGAGHQWVLDGEVVQ
jgi:hypothetical protein